MRRDGLSCPSQSARQLTTRLLLIIFVAALGMRAGWGTFRMFRSPDPYALEFPDEVDYWSLAKSMARGDGLIGEHGFRALRMPLFPAALSLFAPLAGGVIYAKAAQWVVGACAAVLVALLGARIAGRTTGLLAGMLVAFDPFLVFFSSLLLTETLFITALCALWLVGWNLHERDEPAKPTKWLPLGLLAALCVYIRESSIALSAAWIGLLMLRRKLDRRAIVGSGLVVVVVGAALLPWALRNARLTGRMCWLTNRGGISLYDGVGPQATGASDLGSIKQMDAVRGLDEVTWNRYFMTEAVRSIKSDPARIARLATVKICRTWNPLPNVDTYQSRLVRLVSISWTIPIYASAVIGVIYLRRRPGAVVALLLPAAYVIMLHAVFVGSVRYRLVAIPMLEILAAVGIVMLVTRRTGSPVRGSESRPSP